MILNDSETVANEFPPWYVTGLLEGRASFTYSRSRRTGQVNVVFAMCESAANRGLLEALSGFFGDAGRIYASRTDGTRASSCSYRVTRPSELLRIVSHLDRHPLRGAKATVYRVWREMVHLRAAYSGQPPPDELLHLARSLSSGAAPRSEPR